MTLRQLINLSLLPLALAACADEDPDVGERASAICPTWPHCPPPPDEPEPTPLANLVADIKSQNNCHPGTFTYRATNKGDVVASDFRVYLYKSGALVETRYVASLAPAATISFGYVQPTLLPDGAKFEVKVDATGAVTEYNEGDNRKLWQCIY